MASHGKVCPGFLFHRRRKTTNLMDNEIHVTAETFCDSVILARTVISKHSAILARRGYKEGIAIVHSVEHNIIIRSMLRIEPTSSLFTQPAKRTKKFSN